MESSQVYEIYTLIHLGGFFLSLFIYLFFGTYQIPVGQLFLSSLQLISPAVLWDTENICLLAIWFKKISFCMLSLLTYVHLKESHIILSFSLVESIYFFADFHILVLMAT